MARAPKVFAARVGFFDTVIAAPSQKAALEAWGAERNWFGEGLAAPTQDTQAVADALAHPGQVLRRPVGSAGPYTADAAAADIPVPAGARPKKKANAAAEKAKAPPPPDRSALDRAERELTAFEREREETRAEFDRRRAELEAEAALAETGLRSRERALAKAVDKARAAYVKAGGKA